MYSRKFKQRQSEHYTAVGIISAAPSPSRDTIAASEIVGRAFIFSAFCIIHASENKHRGGGKSNCAFSPHSSRRKTAPGRTPLDCRRVTHRRRFRVPPPPPLCDIILLLARRSVVTPPPAVSASRGPVMYISAASPILYTMHAHPPTHPHTPTYRKRSRTSVLAPGPVNNMYKIGRLLQKHDDDSR